MRGKEGHLQFFFQPLRITPAYAGKSAKRLAEITRTKDHPRLCGEKFFSNLTHRHFLWITPAYAGKSRLYCQAVPVLQDHPRLCGEKLIHCTPVRLPVGSPPPMRGKAANSETGEVKSGITPAYAGKSKE